MKGKISTAKTAETAVINKIKQKNIGNITGAARIIVR